MGCGDQPRGPGLPQQGGAVQGLGVTVWGSLWRLLWGCAACPTSRAGTPLLLSGASFSASSVSSGRGALPKALKRPVQFSMLHILLRTASCTCIQRLLRGAVCRVVHLHSLCQAQPGLPSLKIALSLCPGSLCWGASLLQLGIGLRSLLGHCWPFPEQLTKALIPFGFL